VFLDTTIPAAALGNYLGSVLLPLKSVTGGVLKVSMLVIANYIPMMTVSLCRKLKIIDCLGVAPALIGCTLLVLLLIWVRFTVFLIHGLTSMINHIVPSLFRGIQLS
jgi:hypothetical protein